MPKWPSYQNIWVLKCESNTYQLELPSQPAFQIMDRTLLLKKKYFTGLFHLSVKGKNQRCPTSKKTMQCELRKHQAVVPQMPLQSPGEHSSRIAHNTFSVPKGNYLRFPVFSFVWHVFLLHFISLSILYSMKSLQKAIYHIILLSAIFMYHQRFEN